MKLWYCLILFKINLRLQSKIFDSGYILLQNANGYYIFLTLFLNFDWYQIHLDYLRISNKVNLLSFCEIFRLLLENEDCMAGHAKILYFFRLNNFQLIYYEIPSHYHYLFLWGSHCILELFLDILILF